MAKPSLFKHWKFSNLVATLEIPKPYALGLLEFMWDHCYESGDPFLGTSKAIKITCDWDGDADVLTSALLESGFIDEVSEGKFQVHDLHENAPSYVKDRWKKRENYRKTSEISLDNSKKTPDKKREFTPSLPLPSLHIKEKDKTLLSDSDESNESVFEQFWKCYEKKNKGGKAKAKAKFNKYSRQKQLEVIEGTKKHVEFWNQSGREHKYRPLPLTFLNREDWKEIPDYGNSNGNGVVKRVPVDEDGRPIVVHDPSEDMI